MRVNSKNNKGLTPLHLAARTCNEPLVKTFIKAAAQINVQDKKGNTPLHFSAFANVLIASWLMLSIAAASLTVSNSLSFPIKRSISSDGIRRKRPIYTVFNFPTCVQFLAAAN